MSVLVKICGLNDAAAIAAASTADFAGFVFFPRSPRHVDPGAAGALAAALPRGVRRVAVTVDADDDAIAAIMAGLAPDLVQLHGREGPARAAEVGRRFGVGTIKAMAVSEPADLDRAADFAGAADWLLFDARPPARPDALPGGNATSFDWTILAGRRLPLPWLLSGGLDAGNVAAAVAASGARAVDVSSGVESAPGRKDPARIAAFLRAAQG
ncbi:MAG: phosphoribosylanthranilate isomerase [Alphaproteobacteria bacterium]|nr:phosphoribosylanthranilate isomerase [Alphaproteobacteria bacterium]MBM3628297.1 phosphoribosylanthranilate isomerase [Alphaproteobacteria bacterium]